MSFLRIQIILLSSVLTGCIVSWSEARVTHHECVEQCMEEAEGRHNHDRRNFCDDTCREDVTTFTLQGSDDHDCGQQEDPQPESAPDSDGDGLSDEVEDERGTDPQNPDTDGDGYSDGEEIDCGSSPLDPFMTCEEEIDSDNDGVSDEDEEARGIDPLNPDTDGDGDLDGEELDCGSSPLDPHMTCPEDELDPLPESEREEPEDESNEEESGNEESDGSSEEDDTVCPEEE